MCEMQIKLAENYGFCFGVKRAIKIAEKSPNAITSGPLIHNNQEINRLKTSFNVSTAHDMSEIKDKNKVIIRTHGIPKNDLEDLKKNNADVYDATCPYVTKPQQICEDMSSKGYEIVIFGDIEHPEVKSVMSYSKTPPIVIRSSEELDGLAIKSKVAIVSQTTKKHEDFAKIIASLSRRCKEVRVFNTICNATFENQDAIDDLSREADVMIIIGGRSSSNTKQLYKISKNNCKSSYHIESDEELEKSWFEGKKLCGISAGASTPDWIIKQTIEAIKNI
ncbi:MAG: 4-hydroxy-3-methylbut-2-enyl diphosphate reductase (EC [uncultured Campylobacterales bacterium]|uniref:4-hydroxy-3-methylbut-2-enyl diphosphate reductase n=1 Tax=uncultured Campylobacterales bacterium TaxID=352960 RepID=A0A6S6T709_9BACT|nr:MAG: 4-hydroxy-3-methylbut-2-enyl diphosphate reductase (EC [uncultured Campylobacterales bacterium]